jgi:hypothetical protein
MNALAGSSRSSECGGPGHVCVGTNDVVLREMWTQVEGLKGQLVQTRANTHVTERHQLVARWRQSTFKLSLGGESWLAPLVTTAAGTQAWHPPDQ